MLPSSHIPTRLRQLGRKEESHVCDKRGEAETLRTREGGMLPVRRAGEAH
jgi:hypothetical protein